MKFTIQRLTPDHATAVVACFQRVYGDTYAEDLFYDSQRMARRLEDGSLRSVGAVTERRQIVGHMAMTIVDPRLSPELGNTVVDPDMRGSGLAWQIGAELTGWCAELGYQGFIHYPTAAHHVMQRQSVKGGFEVGLMLGYIPAETDGKVSDRKNSGREAATIVYEPVNAQIDQPSPEFTCYLPAYGADVIQAACAAIGLQRHWQAASTPVLAQFSQTQNTEYPRRDLARLKVSCVGADIAAVIKQQNMTRYACQQIDILMDSPAINVAVDAALQQGYCFCGWLPGHQGTDVLRLQKVDAQQTSFAPALENPFAQKLLTWLRA